MALDFTAHYNASLGGVAFFERYSEAFAAPGADALQDVALVRIPGSSTTVIQDFGLNTRQFSVPATINAAHLTNLLAKRGQTVTLVRASGVSVSVYVQGFTEPRVAGYSIDLYDLTIKLVL